MKKPVGLSLDKEVVDYFKALANESGLSYQGLINFCLRQCMVAGFHIRPVNIPCRAIEPPPKARPR